MTDLHRHRELPIRPEFTDALRPNALSTGQITSLYKASSEIFKPEYNLSFSDNICGEEVEISKATAEIMVEGNVMNAKVATIKNTKDIAFLIYNQDTDPKHTPNPYLLRIISPRNGAKNPTLMLDGNDLSSSINNNDDFLVALDIVSKIRKDYIFNLEEAKNYYNNKIDIQFKNNKRRVLKMSAGLIAICGSYYTAFIGGGDANYNDIQMPAPVEWIVDINNHIDHLAQGFDKPEGAVKIDEEYKSNLPLLEDYDTQNVPSTSTVDAISGNEISPGLYKLTLNSQNAESQVIVDERFRSILTGQIEKAFEDCRGQSDEDCLNLIQAALESTENQSIKKCNIVDVNITLGEVRTFVKDPALSKALYLNYSDNVINICTTPGKEIPSGDVYFYQDIPE